MGTTDAWWDEAGGSGMSDPEGVALPGSGPKDSLPMLAVRGGQG